MSISILPCQITDAEEISAMGAEAFATDALNLSLFDRRTATPAQRAEHLAWRAAVFKQRFTGTGRYYFKAVDDTTGSIVGYVGLFAPSVDIGSNVHPENIPTPTFVNANNEKALMDTFRQMEKKHIDGRKGVWYIPSMAVHPAVQGRGVGKRLLGRALEEVDKAGQAAYLEASPAGMRLYESCGFKEIDTCCILGDERYKVGIMLRPAQGETELQ